jgi:hypothetical protein
VGTIEQRGIGGRAADQQGVESGEHAEPLVGVEPLQLGGDDRGVLP